MRRIMTYCCSHGIDAKYKYCNIYICLYIYNSFIATRFRCPLGENPFYKSNERNFIFISQNTFHFDWWNLFRILFIERRSFVRRSIDLCVSPRWSPVKVASEDDDWAFLVFLMLNICAKNCFDNRQDRTIIMNNNDDFIFKTA